MGCINHGRKGGDRRETFTANIRQYYVYRTSSNPISYNVNAFDPLWIIPGSDHGLEQGKPGISRFSSGNLDWNTLNLNNRIQLGRTNLMGAKKLAAKMRGSLINVCIE